MSVIRNAELRAPFPWFGGKSRAAEIIWQRLGDVPNYVEPFAGSLAVMLGRQTPPGIETVNDLDCVAPATRIWKADLTWAPAGEIKAGDRLIGFDEQNGEAREGLRAPKRYRRLAQATVTGVRRLRKPCYRLTFDDGTTVVASEDHLWLGGSHKSSGRGWRWVKTAGMVCNRKTQRTWVLKVADVLGREETHDAGWLGGVLDGEGSLHAGPGLRVTMSQNEGLVLDRAEKLFNARGLPCERSGVRRCRSLAVSRSMGDVFSLLMRFRPERLIRKLTENLGSLSLYGREHRAVGLVSKEFLGEQEVVAIETDCRTFIAEGLASHNCYLANFWRAVQHAPEEVAQWADYPVNEADLHARHLWLVNQAAFREKMKTDPDWFDAKIAGWWVWGISCWIGSGWCSRPEWNGRINASRAERGVQRSGLREKDDRRPHIITAGMGLNGSGFLCEKKRPDLHDQKGVHRKRPNMETGKGVVRRGLSRQIPDLGGHRSAAGRGVHGSGKVRREAIVLWMHELSERLRRVRVCCGDWKRVLGRSPTECIGVTGILLDPPYTDRAERRKHIYAEDSFDIGHEVREWAVINGENPLLRIVLCGYEGEHDMPDGWIKVAWKANGGHGNSGTGKGRANAERERIWFSPACLQPQAELFAR
jgi:hypothetical protein